MTTFTLIRAHSGFQNIPDQFAVVVPGYEDACDEYTETVARYVLPEGYEISKDGYGDLAIYGPDGHCEIGEHNHSGRPQLVSQNRFRAPVLASA